MNIITSLAIYANDNMYRTSVETLSVGAILTIYLFVLFAVLASYAIYAFLLSRIFKKAGVAEWIAWVPFYNNWKMLEIGGQEGIWAVLALIPIVSIVSAVFIYIAQYQIGLKLGKEGWWVVLAIFVPIIWYAILAFDDSKWQDTKPANA